jgi:SAM-dependent methyltransferase
MNKTPLIKVVSSAQYFRRLARQLPTSQDTVLEIGCSTGEATRVLAATGARVLAVDLAAEMIEALQAEMAEVDNVRVVWVDGRDMTVLAEMAGQPDLIFLDVGGNALLGNVASVLRQCLKTFTPRMIIVRSFELAHMAYLIDEVEPPQKLLTPTLEERLGHALGSLVALSQSQVDSDRVFAARKLRDLGTAQAKERLEQMRDDPNSKVRRIATHSLRKPS